MNSVRINLKNVCEHLNANNKLFSPCMKIKKMTFNAKEKQYDLTMT